MKVSYTIVTILALAWSTAAEPEPESVEELLHHVHIGTTMPHGNFVTKENPLHRRVPAHHHSHHRSHGQHHLGDTHLHDSSRHSHHRHHPIDLYLERAHYEWDYHMYDTHNPHSCLDLQESTERDALVIHHLLKSAGSITWGIEQLSADRAHEHAPQHEHKHEHEHDASSTSKNHGHHGLLHHEEEETTCEALEDGTLLQLKMVEHLLDSAKIVVAELRGRWKGAARRGLRDIEHKATKQLHKHVHHHARDLEEEE